jgi:signal transduction histidine kinase/ligand-binding sensor domain-containing protein/DNA-binding response OmpR family regulator
MLQDKKGFMWFGTEDGLNRFDGYQFKVYKNNPDDSTSISYNNVSAIYEDTAANIWLGTFTGEVNRFDPKTEIFTRYKINIKQPSIYSFKRVTAITRDSKGTFWAGTSGNGLYYLKPGQKKFELFDKLPDDSDNGSIRALATDREGVLWIGTTKGLYSYNPASKLLTHYKNDPFNPLSIKSDIINTFFINKNGKLLIGTNLGIDQYDVNKQFIHLNGISKTNETLDSISITAIQEDEENQLWLGTSDGVIKFNPQTKHFQTFRHSSTDLKSLSVSGVVSIEMDREGGIWVGTRSGVNYYHKILHQFSNYVMAEDDPHSLPVEHVWGIREDAQGVMWIAGFPFDLNEGVIPDSKLDPIVVKEIIKADRRFLSEDIYGKIWASAEDGLYGIDRKTGQVEHFTHNPLDSQSLGNNTIWNLLGKKDGNVWFKLRNGLSIFTPQTKKFENYYHSNNLEGLGPSSINHYLQDYLGNIWLGTRSGGLILFDYKRKTFKHIQHNPDDDTSISDDVIHDIFEDSARRLWLSTAKGLDLYDRENNKFIHFQEKDGLSDNFIFGIKEDSKGMLWLSTNNQIFSFDPDKKKFRGYDKHDGLEGGGYHDGSYYQSLRTGLIFFGGIGVTVFHPDSIRDNTFIPPVVISRFQYLVRGKDGSVLTEEEGIAEKKEIKLTHQQKTLLLFEFASLSFSKTGKNQYKYQLTGYSDDWVLLGTRREASFTNLAPGFYTLRIQGSNGDGIWNEIPTELKIRILPPWYWNGWTKTLYALLLIGALFYFYRFQLNRRLALERAELAEERELLAHQRTQQLVELDDAKTNLYTNITHEFRTPLTIILGMADQIERSPRQWLQEGLQMIKRSGQDLLRLVNQMLDLARLEGGKLPVNMVQSDIIVYVKTLLEFFRSYADSKNITLEFTSEPGQIIMDFDPDKIKDIISNLLSNALKFTPEGGEIKLEVGSTEYETRDVPRTSYFQLCVRDNGAGIPPEKLPYIFDRFYQADDSATRRGEGTGIGLALTRELVKLLNGDIQVNSEMGQGSTFTVSLPIYHSAPLVKTVATIKSEVIEKDVIIKETFNNRNKELPLALIVEDNVDVVTYLTTCLKDKYRTEIAYDGKAGINKAIEIVPDVIISDVMMPEKDGFELCRTLKNDIRTSHIPIILLTARADMDSRLEGLEGGADAYLTKPFNQQELEISLRKSLELRQRLRERYAHDIPLETDKFFSRDDIFVKELKALVEAEYATLTIPDMAKKMNMSHPQLGRKVNALLNTSPHQYLHRYRMQKAYHLVKNTDMPLQDIAYQTGFSDPSNFSNAFLKEFQQRPKDLR